MANLKVLKAEKRNLLSSFFITLLIGIAYQQMITTVDTSIRVNGITIENILLILTFFFISMRFFIGNQLHLLSDAFLRLPGLVWIYDLMVIIVQSMIFIFLGGYVTVGANANSGIGFIELLIMLYSVDVGWISSQWLLGKYYPRWKREFVPKEWAILNFALVVIMVCVFILFDNLYCLGGVALIFIINLLGFIIDVVLIDHYEII